MKQFISIALSALIIGSTAAPALAWDRDRDRHRGYDRHRHHERHSNRIDPGLAIGLGVAGIVTGAIIGNQIRQTPPPPPPRYYPAPPPRHVTSRYGQPWSPEWYRYCSNTYRSFNPRTGTFKPIRGPEQFCEVPRAYR